MPARRRPPISPPSYGSPNSWGSAGSARGRARVPTRTSHASREPVQAGSGVGGVSVSGASDGGATEPADLGDVGAETQRFVASRLSCSSKDDDDEFEQVFRVAVATSPEVVPSPSQRRLDRAHAENRRALEERKILMEMRLAARSSPRSSSPASAATGSPKFDYAASSRSATDALKQVKQFVRAQADADQQAVMAELESKTRSTLGGPLGKLAEDEEEDSDPDDDEDAVRLSGRLAAARLLDDEEEVSRRMEAAAWERVDTNWLDASGQRRR